jgi:hypothetical protein
MEGCFGRPSGMNEGIKASRTQPWARGDTDGERMLVRVPERPCLGVEVGAGLVEEAARLRPLSSSVLD